MKKRILSIVLAICLVLTLVPTTVFADEETTTAPSVSVYATKAQLTDETFAPDSDGYDTNIGKLAFGVDEDGKSQEWYILGKDTGVNGDNTVIFADSSMTFGYFENKRDEIKTDTILWNNCEYTGDSPSQVYPNHYGASDIRYGLNVIAHDASRFTPAEQGLMNFTKVTTTDTMNNVDYTTTDRLYLLHGDEDEYRVWAGSNNQIPLANESYWNSGDDFWLRTPSVDEYTDVIGAVPGDFTAAHVVNDDGTCAQPASNLDLTDVLFSSAVTDKPSNDGPSCGTIASDKAMALRLDGSSMDIGTVEYDPESDTIKAQRGSISGKVALVVQGKNFIQSKNEETDWFYSELVNGDYSISADLIKLACGLSSLNLENCKIWLETVGNDGMIYAVNETQKISSVEITNIDTPSVNTAFDNEAACATPGVSSNTPSVKWTPEHTTAKYNTSYTASVTLTAGAGYEFAESTTATVNGNTATSVKKNDDGTLTVTYKFSAIPDTIAPTGEISIGTNIWTEPLSDITFDLFFKDMQTVTITAADNSGEAVKIEYLLSGEELTLTQLNTATFTAYTGEFSINPDNEYVIYSRLTDTSNNVKYINSNGIVLDATAPVISGVENGETYCEAQTVTVTDKYLDSVTLNGTEVTLDTSNQFTLNSEDGEQTIVATDKAGNKAQMTVTVKNGHTDEDGDHICDVCGAKASNHIDNDNDGKCDICSADIDVDSETENKNTNKDTSKKSPQTGNDEYALYFAMLFALCGAGIITASVYSKRKKRSI